MFSARASKRIIGCQGNVSEIMAVREQAASGRVSLPPIVTSSPLHARTHPTATARSRRAFSRKLQELMKVETKMRGWEAGGGWRGEVDGRWKREKFEPKNWKQLTEKQLNKLTPVARSRYLAYEAPPKDVQDKQVETLKRVREMKSMERQWQVGPTLSELIERERQSELVGQLKAAEARHRIQVMRTRYDYGMAAELRHLIASQPSSIEAVRLKTFVLPHLQTLDLPEILNKQERTRCEVILEDEDGLTINRTA